MIVDNSVVVVERKEKGSGSSPLAYTVNKCLITKFTRSASRVNSPTG